MKKILLFTGAGFTAPLGLPTTTQFADRIKRGEATITRHVGEYLGKAGNDIESILSALESFSQEVGITEFLLPRMGIHPNSVNDVIVRIKDLRSQAPGEITRIRKIIFDTLQSFEASQATELYLNTYKQMKAHYGEIALSIVTTNYDLTFEAGFEAAPEEWDASGVKQIDFGFPIEYGRPIYDPKAPVEWHPEAIDFLKVHGSLDWHRDKNGKISRAGVATTPNDPAQIPILYPGFKSVPEKEPFFSLHSKFFKRLTEAEIVFVVGFAFRDSYINNLFENVIRSNPSIPIYCLNPIKREQAPDESRLPYFAAKYSSFNHLELKIDLGANPLGEAIPVTSTTGLPDVATES